MIFADQDVPAVHAAGMMQTFVREVTRIIFGRNGVVASHLLVAGVASGFAATRSDHDPHVPIAYELTFAVCLASEITFEIAEFAAMGNTSVAVNHAARLTAASRAVALHGRPAPFEAHECGLGSIAFCQAGLFADRSVFGLTTGAEDHQSNEQRAADALTCAMQKVTA
jgi:hypothetical protein